MLRLIFLLFCACVVTACAGTIYQLPQVTDADVLAMQKKISDNKKPLKVYKRTDTQYKKITHDITKRLVKNAKPLCDHAGYTACHFEVDYNNKSTFNAYASEGYKIVVFRGLLQHLKNNDEIAAVIAHEMGHHLAKHNEKTMQNATAGAAVSGILTAVILAATNANNAYYNPYQDYQNQQTIENMMNLGAKLGVVTYSKEQEQEADLLATYLLSRAGYDLKRAQNIMLVLSESSGETETHRSAFLDTHPAGIERFVAWEKAIDEVKDNPEKLPYRKTVNANKTTTMH
jgi:predicted Zn-dependent protease